MERNPTEPVIIEVDAGSRADLRGLAAETPARYLAHTEPDGTIVLVPTGLETGLEPRFTANRELVARIEDNRAHPERLVRRPGKDT